MTAQSVESGRDESRHKRKSSGRIITMVLADVGLVIAQIIMFSAAATNDKALGLPMLLLTAIFAFGIAWAAITARGWLWFRIFNGLLLGIFIIGWAIVMVMTAVGPD